jgi:hypothetical protein
MPAANRADLEQLPVPPEIIGAIESIGDGLAEIHAALAEPGEVVICTVRFAGPNGTRHLARFAVQGVTEGEGASPPVLVSPGVEGVQ